MWSIPPILSRALSKSNTLPGILIAIVILYDINFNKYLVANKNEKSDN